MSLDFSQQYDAPIVTTSLTPQDEGEIIEWSCAASTITPVAVFKPVELEGTTVLSLLQG